MRTAHLLCNAMQPSCLLRTAQIGLVYNQILGRIFLLWELEERADSSTIIPALTSLKTKCPKKGCRILSQCPPFCCFHDVFRRQMLC